MTGGDAKRYNQLSRPQNAEYPNQTFPRTPARLQHWCRHLLCRGGRLQAIHLLGCIIDVFGAITF
jgi:hypothetical protein